MKKSANFDVQTMFQGDTDLVIGDKITEFFIAITDEYDPLPECPTLPVSPIVLDFHVVAAALKAFKKTKSMVKCDIFPDLSTKFGERIYP